MSLSDKRNFRRHRKELNFVLKHRKGLFNAKTFDYSLDGIGITIRDGDIHEIEKGAIVGYRLDCPEIEMFGEVVWKHQAEAESGFRLGIRNVGMLSGQLKDFRISDTLIGLQRSQKTGILTVESAELVRKIYIKNGDMIFAVSNREEDRLGDLLLSEGKISREQYDHSVEVLKRTGQRQGGILVRLGYMKAPELVAAVRHQVEHIIISLFDLDEGRFEFREMPLPNEEVITLKLSAANLIYAGIKRTDKLRLIQGETLSQDSILRFSPYPLDLFQDLKLDLAGRKIVSFIDGQAPIKEIISLSGLDDEEVMKTIHALSNVRMVKIEDRVQACESVPEDVIEEISADRVEDKSEPDSDPKNREMIDNMHQRYESLGYYGVLGVKDSAPNGAIKAAYYKAAKKFHPDMHFHLADDSLKSKLSDIFSFIYEAYATLSNHEKRREYDKLITIRPAKLSENVDKARALFEQGRTEFDNREYKDAELHFGQAVYYYSSISEYHYYYGLVLGKQNKFRAAEKAFESARRLEPHNPVYLAELGFVHLAMGFRKRAQGLFEKALSISPENARATEGMKKVTAD